MSFGFLTHFLQLPRRSARKLLLLFAFFVQYFAIAEHLAWLRERPSARILHRFSEISSRFSHVSIIKIISNQKPKPKTFKNPSTTNSQFFKKRPILVKKIHDFPKKLHCIIEDWLRYRKMPRFANDWYSL